MTKTSRFADGFMSYFGSRAMLRGQPRLDATSLPSAALTMLYGEQVLAKGTGFFWRLHDGVALTTAWHNVSGLHHTERSTISRHGGMPDAVRVRYTPRQPGDFQEQRIPLYLDDEMEEPRWFVHHQCGSHFDIAFLRLQLNGHDVFCVNEQAGISADYVNPGADVFAIGYPQGISTLGVIPIWKRGSLASEIDLPTDGHPKFLIDIAGRGGLSGAPVYKIQRGLIVEGDASNAKVAIGSKTEFLGLYSGRAADQLPPDQRGADSSDLGFVWRGDIVAETLNNGVLDEKPEVGKGKITMTSFFGKGMDGDKP